VHKATIVMTVLLLAPATLRAEEIQFGIRSNVSWTDNVYGTPEDFETAGREEDAIDDYSLRMSPWLALKDEDGELTWDLRYQPSYEVYLDQGELDGFDQAISAGLAWRLSDRWSFALRENYYLNQSTVRFNEVAGPGEEVTLGFRDQEVRSNRTSASLTHLLTPLDSLVFSVGYTTYEYPDTDRGDRENPYSSLAYDHRFTERTAAGMRFSFTRQSNEGNFADDQTDFYNLSGTLRHAFSPTFRVEAAAGPTLVDTSPRGESASFTIPVVGRDVNIVVDGVPVRGRLPYAIDANTCAEDPHPDIGRVADLRFGEPCDIVGNVASFLSEAELAAIRASTAVLPMINENGRPVDSGDLEENNLNFFARLALTKEWETWDGTLGYQRSNSENARLGSSSVADTIWGSLNWRPDPFWTVVLSASASLQQQATDQAIPIGLEVANVPAPEGVDLPELAQIQRIIVSTDGNDVEYRTQAAMLRATRRLTRRSSAFASVRWYQQEQEVSAAVDETTRWEDFTFSIGLEWQFDPMRF
jgi:hypothetical protein